MNIKKAEAIIDYVVLTTKPLWERWINLSYADLDEIFLQSAYEQGGFAATAFYMLMGEEGIASIGIPGMNYMGLERMYLITWSEISKNLNSVRILLN